MGYLNYNELAGLGYDATDPRQAMYAAHALRNMNYGSESPAVKAARDAAWARADRAAKQRAAALALHKQQLEAQQARIAEHNRQTREARGHIEALNRIQNTPSSEPSFQSKGPPIRYSSPPNTPAEQRYQSAMALNLPSSYQVGPPPSISSTPPPEKPCPYGQTRNVHGYCAGAIYTHAGGGSSNQIVRK